MILTGKKPEVIGNNPGEVAREGDRIGAGDGLPADFDFSAPLINDLILERGTGTATFARTTTGFVQDNEDIFNLIDIAAARFKGARYLGSGLFSNLDSLGDPISSVILKGFLSEAQNTNPILRSREFNISPWSTVASLILAQDETGIDGQENKAWTLTDNNVSGNSQLRQNFLIPMNTDIHTLSVFIKKDNDESRFPAVTLATLGLVTIGVTIQLNTKTGAFNFITGTFGNVVDMGDWWFVSASVGSDGTTTIARIQIRPASSTTWGILENAATGSIIVDQTQTDLDMLFPSSPIETIASSVTRTIDLLQYPVLDNVEINNISCFIKWTPTQDDLGTVFIWASYVDADNYTALLHDGTDLIIRKRISGVNNDATITLDYDNNVIYTIGWRFSDSDGIDIWLDGIKGTNDTDVADIQLGTNFEIGSDGNGANHDYSYHKENEIWHRTLSDSEMAALTL